LPFWQLSNAVNSDHPGTLTFCSRGYSCSATRTRGNPEWLARNLLFFL